METRRGKLRDPFTPFEPQPEALLELATNEELPDKA
jgi:hypothetical protein